MQNLQPLYVVQRFLQISDLARLGGWKTEQTILTCYQDSDLGAMQRGGCGR